MLSSPLVRVAAPLLVVLATAACGDDDGDKSAADLKTEISDELQSGDDGLPEEAADCFADIIIDEVGVEKLRDVDFQADSPPEDVEEEFTAATTRALDECDLTGAGG